MKLLRDKKYYLLLVVALMVYLFLVKSDEILPIQEHSSQEFNKTVVDKVNQDKSSLISKVKKDLEVKEKKLAINDEAPIKVGDISYLQAYRDYQFFQKCYWVIREAQSGEDLDVIFKQKIKDSAVRLKQVETYPTQKQEAAFEVFKNKCFDLMIVQDKNFNENKKLLKQKYQDIKPSSEEEKHLHQGLALHQEYKTVNGQIYRLKQGELDLEDPLVVSLKKRIFNLNSEIARIKWEGDDFYENETKQSQVRALQDVVSKLQKELNAFRFYDPEMTSLLEERRVNILEKMVLLLKNNESPEILLLYGKLLLYPYVERKLSIDFFSEIKVYDQALAASIYDVGITLAACALIYPCGKDSQLSVGYCFNDFIVHKESCGIPVEDYLFSEVISPNQLQDVDKFITAVLKNYAKN